MSKKIPTIHIFNYYLSIPVKKGVFMSMKEACEITGKHFNLPAEEILEIVLYYRKLQLENMK